MNYTQIPVTYKYDILAEAIYSRELEHFHYNLDAANFTHLLANEPEGTYKQELQARLISTQEQMAKVLNIYKALVAQIDNQTEYAAAMNRAVQKRNAPIN